MREESVVEEERDETGTEDEVVKMKNLKNAEERRLSLVAQRIVNEAMAVGGSEETLQKLKSAADSLVRLATVLAEFPMGSQSFLFYFILFWF